MDEHRSGAFCPDLSLAIAVPTEIQIHLNIDFALARKKRPGGNCRAA
jgi:hypothetical protein